MSETSCLSSVSFPLQMTDMESMSCILHIQDLSKEEKLHTFNDDKWKTVQQAAKKRLLQQKCKYKPLCETLPDMYSSTDGYHRTCYKNFTAVPKDITTNESSTYTDHDKSNLLRSQTASVASNTAGVFDKNCIFCHHYKKSIGSHRYELVSSCETREAQDHTVEAAEGLDDQELLTTIRGIDFVAKEVKYHRTCQKNYFARWDRIKAKNESDASAAHKLAFEAIVPHLNALISDNKAMRLATLHEAYTGTLSEHGFSNSSYSAQSLETKIQGYYEDALNIEKVSCKQGKIVFPKTMNITAAKAFVEDKSEMFLKVEEVAVFLKNEILKMKQNTSSLPYPLSAEQVAKGEGEIPSAVRQFFTALYSGCSAVADDSSSRIVRFIESSAEDAIYIVTRGQVKPAKHCLLGIGLKSITGSKKVLNILNHFGHCIGYHVAEEIETDIAMSISDKGCAAPDGLQQVQGLATAFAFDNYDENCETLSGANTLHDTVGIVYQNIEPQRDAGEEDIRNIPETTGKKRKRSFDTPMPAIAPYMKKPKVQSFTYTDTYPQVPANYELIKKRDTTFMILTSVEKIPMWSAWNSLITVDVLPQQRVCYLQNISLPSTRLDVVAETLRMAQNVASECSEKYAIVTYDLAIAKPASQIQEQEAPLYDNVFVMFGAFHIMMAYFSAVGFYIDGSGGDTIMLDSEVLASGSLQGFLSGKHFNRCKRLHPIMALAFQKLHFQRFLEDQGPIPEALLTGLNDVHDDPSPESMEALEATNDYQYFIQQYEEFCQKTKEGDLGSTAMFWMNYIDMITIWMQFSRACRTNDFNLFVYSLYLMIPMFFVTNKHNYARWMVRYCLNLINIDRSHPGLRDVLGKGALSVRRTSNNFSRNPVDMTLEQTINQDAASRSTGITAFQQNIAAKSRWTATRSARSTMVGSLMTKAGLQQKEDVKKELKPSRVKRDHEDLTKIVEGIEACFNPFTGEKSEKLFSISTGKATSEAVKKDLLSIKQTGQKLFDEFKNGCLQDSNRFEKAISRQKGKNFASEAVKSKITRKDKKVLELKGTRDLFGRLLFLASEMNINLERVFQYPLTPVPLCLGDVHGLKNSTPKHKLAQHLESMMPSESPCQVEVYIVDAMFVIRCFDNKELPASYGGVARHLLKRICKAKRVDFVCDSYPSPSIKGEEQEKRGTSEFDIVISGPKQKRPKDFKAALESKGFKKELFAFLIREWARDVYFDLFEGRVLYVNYDYLCWKFIGVEGKVEKTMIRDLSNTHEEADTLVALHAKHADENLDEPHIVVRANDTDILVILLFHTRHVASKIWMDIGKSSDNTRRYIDVTSLALTIGPMADVLPALHAFTGSDYTASFLRKGKVKPYDKIERSPSYQEVFTKYGDQEDVTHLVTETERFVCDLYGKPQMRKLSDVRYALFRQKYAPSKNATGDLLSSIKGAESSWLPPSEAVLLMKIQRANYVAALWKNAHMQNPLTNFEAGPTECGWALRDGEYRICWFVGEQLPQEVANCLDDLPPENESNDAPVYDSDESECDLD